MSPPRVTRAVLAWAGAGSFALSLLYCGFSYGVRMGQRVELGSSLQPIVVNLALFTAFALHHSAFARSGLKAWVARRAGTDLERPIYVWIASLLLIAVCAAWQPVPGVLWTTPAWLHWLLRLVQLAGVWLTLRSVRLIDVWVLAGVRAPALPTETSFTTRGPYGVVRHPIYSAWLLLVWASPEMTATQAVFAAASSAYLVLAIPLEERSLERCGGVAYRRYKAHVRWKLVPGVY